MTRRLVSWLVVVLLSTLAVTRADDPKDRPDDKDPRGREGNLKAGDAAPDFALKDLKSQRTVRLADLKGKPVVLFFGSCT